MQTVYHKHHKQQRRLQHNRGTREGDKVMHKRGGMKDGGREGRKERAVELLGYVYLLISHPRRRGKSFSCDPDLHFVKQ